MGSVAAAAPAKIVMLDPGHGGSNAGARGAATGLHEKQLSLMLATRVADRLRGRGIAVQLTRTTDRTLTLRQRVALADGAAADLFVSIHANASPTRTQHGYETYVLTARGLDVDGRALRSDADAAPRRGGRHRDDPRRRRARGRAMGSRRARGARPARDPRPARRGRRSRRAPGRAARAARRDDAGGPGRGRVHRPCARGQAARRPRRSRPSSPLRSPRRSRIS